MAAKSKKSEYIADSEETEKKIVTSQDVLQGVLKDEKAFHYNFEEAVTYKVGSGSLVLDSYMGGGMGPGLHRFTGLNEGGKEARLSEPVLTPNGWSIMGSLRVGDEVIDSQGRSQLVLGVYPQGVKDVYKITFDDGSITHCGLEHLWETSSFAERHSKGGLRRSVKPLKDIISTIKYGLNLNHSVRLVNPIQFNKKDFSLDPYLLGVLLGDGSITRYAGITTADNFIKNKIEMILARDFPTASLSRWDEINFSIVFKEQLENPIIRLLKNLNLFGCKSENKFIPKEYLFGCIEQRLHLLHGLIDTDGYVNPKKSEILYYTVSEELANNVIDLVRSLGGLARKRFKKTSYKNKDGKRIVCKDCHVVSFFLPKELKPCSLPRKLENVTHRKINFHHFIKSIEKIGQEESVCIKVSSLDSLYVTADYILTHNTSCALSFMYSFLKRPNAKGFYIKAEGRLSENMIKRSGIKFVYTAAEWVDGTCFVFETNIYETAVSAMRKLVQFNDEKKNYFFVLDSVDGLIAKGDLEKTFEESAKVAGGAVIAANFMKRLSIALTKRGHMAIFISQVRADIKIDTYSKEPIRQTTATGGNALLHFANWILEFNPRFRGDLIVQNPDVKEIDPVKNPIIGHFAKVTVKKSPNEKTNLTIAYPIKYGKTGGPSVWAEKEVVDLLLSWGLIERGKSGWMTCSEDLVAMLAEAGLPEIPKLQGIENLFKFLEANQDIMNFLIQYFKDHIGNEV